MHESDFYTINRFQKINQKVLDDPNFWQLKENRALKQVNLIKIAILVFSSNEERNGGNCELVTTTADAVGTYSSERVELSITIGSTP